MLIKINDKISYIKANENPLSADIGIIKNNDLLWLYDVGNGLNNIKDLNDKYNVVLSHFHLDHIGNIKNININKIYVSKETYKHLPKEVIEENEVIIVTDELTVDNLHLFIIPSSHSKGCLGLEIDDTYAFIGDATYCKFKNNQLSYNAQILKDEIETLNKLKAKYLLISHKDGLIEDKEKVINQLKDIYDKRINNEPEIIIHPI